MCLFISCVRICMFLLTLFHSNTRNWPKTDQYNGHNNMITLANRCILFWKWAWFCHVFEWLSIKFDPHLAHRRWINRWWARSDSGGGALSLVWTTPSINKGVERKEAQFIPVVCGPSRPHARQSHGSCLIFISSFRLSCEPHVNRTLASLQVEERVKDQLDLS